MTCCADVFWDSTRLQKMTRMHTTQTDTPRPLVSPKLDRVHQNRGRVHQNRGRVQGWESVC